MDDPPLPEDITEDSDGMLSVGAYARGYPGIVSALKPLSASDVIATIAGLLTVPDFQANCFRLELLAHLAAAFCRGRVSPASNQISFLFDALDEGMCGAMEDPAENMFVGLVNTSEGNFRIFEGLREGTSFYLQAVLDALETAPCEEPFDLIRRSIDSLLKLSEAIAERSGVSEYDLGNETPVATLPEATAAAVRSASGRASFELKDLTALGIQIDHLHPFIFDPASGPQLLKQEVGNSDLERYPLAQCDGRLHVALPTAIASAITRFVIESAKALQIEKGFERAVASAVVELIANTPILGKLRLPLARTQIDDCLVGHQLVEVDAGRFLQVIVVFESLRGFDHRGLNGAHKFSEAVNAGISALITDAYRMVNEKDQGADGLTLIVSAGLGRGFGYSLSGDLPEEWRVCGMPIHDLMTASWLAEFDPLSLWRIDDAQAALSSLGVILINPSGLLNIIGCTQELKGRIIAEHTVSEPISAERPLVVSLPTNCNRLARREAQERYDIRRVRDVEGRWVRVQKLGASPFEGDSSDRIYMSCDILTEGELLGACVTMTRAWWLRLECSNNDSSRELMFEYWRSLCLWLCQAVSSLESAYPELPSGSILFVFSFDEITASGVGTVHPLDENEVRELVEVIATEGSPTIAIRVRAGFEGGFIQAQNVGDRALVDAMVAGAGISSGLTCGTTRATVLDAICPRGAARRIHRWSSTHFRDFIRGNLTDAPIIPDPIDHASSLLGLGHTLASYTIPCAVSGKENCMSVINGVVETLVKQIISELNSYDRRALVAAVIRNHETAACQREHWRQTSRALVATQPDSVAAMRTIAERNSKYNGCSIASRILLEAALCECPMSSGRTPGVLDIARLMAKVMIVHQFGGWSDAIRWDAMAPEVRITALGEIQANVEFIKNVYQPFGRSGGQSSVEHAIDSYDSFFQQDDLQPSASSELDAEFLAAWEAEFGVSLHAFRAAAIRLEQMAVEANSEVIEISRSRLVALLSEEASVSVAQTAEALASVTSTPRRSWPRVPDGYVLADWYPWRFRRRLAILRRPFLQLDETTDPTILCAPGLINDAFGSMVTWYHKGEIAKARTKQMQALQGRINDVERKKFNRTVAQRLRQLGWEAREEVKVTEILQRSFDRDYGDVDVLALRSETGRILVIECKDLQIHTTIGEVAEQLSDFRGDTRANGKRDHLKRHLDRIAILSANPEAVARFLKFASPRPIEGHLVFSREVPMRFAWEHMANQVKLSLFSTLDAI